MACCGQTAAQALAAGLRVIDERTQGVPGSQTHVKIVYIGDDPKTRAYVTGGNVFQFGNNERRRVNVVPARAVGFFLDERSEHYGKFALFEPELFNEDGSPKVAPSQAPIVSGQLPVVSQPMDSGVGGDMGTVGKKKKE